MREALGLNGLNAFNQRTKVKSKVSVLIFKINARDVVIFLNCLIWVYFIMLSCLCK